MRGRLGMRKSNCAAASLRPLDTLACMCSHPHVISCFRAHCLGTDEPATMENVVAIVGSCGKGNSLEKQLKDVLKSPDRLLSLLSRLVETYSSTSEERKRKLREFSQRMSKLQCELIRYVDEASRLRDLCDDGRSEVIRGEVMGLLSEDTASADLKETLCFYNQLQLKLGSLLSMKEALEESSEALLAECEAARGAAENDEWWWWRWRGVAYVSGLVSVAAGWYFGRQTAGGVGHRVSLQAESALGRRERDNKNLKEELGRVHTEVEGLGCLARETEERVGCRALEKGVGALAHSVCPTAEVVVGTTFEVLDILQGMMNVDFERRIIACGKQQP